MKYLTPAKTDDLGNVASLAEAWIEMLIAQAGGGTLAASPPSRRRGLKSSNARYNGGIDASPPSRRRGLKCFKNCKIPKVEKVASLAEAWIEIRLASLFLFRRMSPPSRRRGLK